MVAKRNDADSSAPRRRRPATTPEDREMELGSLAYDLAERQLRAGTVSAAVHTHFLKAVSIREKRELARLENENLLTKAKIAQAGQADRMEALMENAMRAFTDYRGGHTEEEDEDDDY